MYQILKSAIATLSSGFSRKLLGFRLQTRKNSTNDYLKNIRNIGIIAHIDAGKTTTTERMLYYSGFTNMMGEVHDGDTVMDYMAQERERGITISSAAVTFKWQNHKINLIDTPGHVDFTFEVERSLSVLDGVVVILDASAGVEVQTLKVWEQANRYGVPSIIYLNKLDKPVADVEMCLSSIINKLKVKPLMLHIPLGEGKEFTGVIEPLTLTKHMWDRTGTKKDGVDFLTENFSCNQEDPYFQLGMDERIKIIENIADLDDNFADKYLTEGIESLTDVDFQSALRHITLKRTAVPVFCGSSYKNIAVQLLMDAIVDYLPNPCERNHVVASPDSSELCALAFKIIHNKNKEPLTFLRLYSGILKSGQRIYNKMRGSSEKIEKLMVPLADNFFEVSESSPGNIIVASGFKKVVTGDLLFASGSAASKIFPEQNEALKSLIQIPDPVFFCTIEPPSIGFQKRLEFALQCLEREDPTFRVEFDEAIGQTIIMGMGELHIDVIKERIRIEYGINAYLGPLQVAYREALGKIMEHTHVLDKTVSGSKQFAKITMKFYPQKSPINHVNVIITKDNNLGKIRSDHLKAINEGMKSALSNGPLLNSPVINVGIDLLWLEVGKGTSLTMLSAAASQCIMAAFRKSGMHLLEPIMRLSIAVDKGYAGRVLNDLSRKRSQILNMELREDVEIIQALTPLSELRGYSTHLRALTSGTCSFTIEFSNYQKMESDEQEKTIQEVTGFLK